MPNKNLPNRIYVGVLKSYLGSLYDTADKIAPINQNLSIQLKAIAGRLLDNTKAQLFPELVRSDLNPKEIESLVDKVCQELDNLDISSMVPNHQFLMSEVFLAFKENLYQLAEHIYKRNTNYNNTPLESPPYGNFAKTPVFKPIRHTKRFTDSKLITEDENGRQILIPIQNMPLRMRALKKGPREDNEEGVVSSQPKENHGK